MCKCFILGIFAIFSILLISGCVQEAYKAPVPPPIYICGSAQVRATVVSSFTAPEFESPYITVNLINISYYEFGKSIEQLINNGDVIKIYLIGEVNYSKCFRHECPSQTEGQPQLPCQIISLPCTDEDKYGSWISYNLKEGDKIELFIQGKAYGNCNFKENLHWEAEDSKILRITVIFD
ncbi:MAG: hypothetical protein QXP39_01660 [Candidatus Aenigmatarchaeota archaeon]